MATPAAAAATPKGPVTDAYHKILESIAPNAAVLKQNYNGYLGRGLAAAAAIHIAALGAYWSYIKATEIETVAVSEEPIQVAYADIEPPSIEDAPPPPDAAPPPPSAAAPSGTPTPVPDAEAPEKPQIATQEQLAQSGSGPTGAVGRVTGVPGGTATAAAPPPPPAPPPPAPPPPAPPPPAPPPPPPAGPLDFSEVQPELIGGIEGLQSGIEYPDFERRAGTEGRVIVRFVVSPEGVPSQIEVVRRVSPGLDQAAVRAVERARFNPGKQNGQAVSVRFTLPVTFRIR